jgi:ferredoxin/coenzyme F420-reducing hydrogenase delta subunit
MRSIAPEFTEPSGDLLELARKSNGGRQPEIQEPATRFDWVLRFLDDQWQRFDQLISRLLPASLNPLHQLGAIANTCLIIAVISGVLLLFWYSPSVHQAYASLENLRTSSWLGQLVRSVHRYSSDACLFFVLLHAFRILAQRRFTGARWLPWTTGVLLLATLWFVGWTGYWLVWDVRAQHTALGTAKFLDQLPIFTEPLSRSFLTNASVPSLLFFLIFFVHMLTPLALGIGLWIHLARVNRARFLATRQMTAWVCVSLVLLSLAAPAFNAAPADMTAKVAEFKIDWWFLWPLALTERFAGGTLWSMFMFGGLAFFTIPWTLARKQVLGSKAEVDLPRCIGCSLCAKDCPFNAITMIPREDGRKFDVQSFVNPALCVGCGICTGACDSQAINLPRLNSRDVERGLVQWIEAQTANRDEAFIAFCCGESAASALKPGAQNQSTLLPGFRVQSVPCVGWVSAIMLERLLMRGASGILVVGCGEGDPVAREGQTWFSDRMNGVREPKFDTRKADSSRILHIRVNRAEQRALTSIAADFRAGRARKYSRQGPVRKTLGAVALAAGLTVAAYSLSNLTFRLPHAASPELIVSFNHSGALLETKKLSQKELDRRLPHMRAQINVSRERTPVGMRISIDGIVVHEDFFEPRGLQNDGPSIASVRLPVSEGRHHVRVDLSDGPERGVWTKHWDEEVLFEASRNRVVLFDAKSGFTLH